ncbi:hypothetical protein PCANC_12621 [Puccinia coronata f. sp. avenae]|uniref:Mitochondrial adapter protein MCP1 transmembrane domain-containing protein n=1 Tax=Puccinia coronata f. sp. avenae TaxID=200324 RepID=A0A2N5VND3_9BASI|nr:hypothetical protein PCASD_21328 [Puccinia coronata f. sp. avenae]PLW19793.1 hypothetical protein PCANC_12621 [Puccinia coronata f. sp. avenae]PLW51513.1 hypothetical protein PCASD_00391 [Puccinia coronata f. sp. avenae]
MEAKKMTLDRILELAQDLSGLAFSSFMVVHLASPIGAAILGGSGGRSSESVASSIQLAGRVVYQDGRFREALFVWIPLGTHLVVALLRRVTRINRQRKIRAQLELRAQAAEDLPPSGRRTRAMTQSTAQWLMSYLPSTSHAIAGYVAIPFLINHIVNHRLSASPSLRSFQFVSFNLQQYPLLASIQYAGLLSASLYHALVGLDQVFSRLLPSSTKPPGRKSIASSQRSVSVRLGWLGIIGTVGFGIRKLAREPVPLWMARRYR